MKNELQIKLDNKAQEVIGEVAKEHGGGATYTAGNGIDITNENVINADIKVLEVVDITQLTDEQCESLEVGDMISTGQRYYSVFSKTDEELMLVINYFTPGDSEYNIMYYSKAGDGHWNFDIQLYNALQSKFNVVQFDSQGGTIELEEVQKAVNNGGAVVSTPIGEEVVLFVLGNENAYFSSSLVTEENTTFYYKVSIGQPYEDDGVQVCDYTVEQLTVGGSIEYVHINTNATEIDLETARKLTGPNKNNYIIELNDNTKTSPGIYLHPNGEYTNSWTSNIIDGSYWEFKITDWQEKGIYVTIRQVQVGGGSVNNIFKLIVQNTSSYETGTLSQKDLEDLTDLLSSGDVTVEITEDGGNKSIYLTKVSHYENVVQNTYNFNAIIGTGSVDSYSLNVNLTNGHWQYYVVNLYSAPN